MIVSKLGVIDVFLEILYLICEIKLFEMFKNGDIVKIIDMWDIILFCLFFKIDVMCIKIEKCFLESLDKVWEFELNKFFKKFEELC